MHSPANFKIFMKAKCVAVLLEIYMSFYLKFDFFLYWSTYSFTRPVFPAWHNTLSCICSSYWVCTHIERLKCIALVIEKNRDLTYSLVCYNFIVSQMAFCMKKSRNNQFNCLGLVNKCMDVDQLQFCLDIHVQITQGNQVVKFTIWNNWLLIQQMLLYD